MIVRRLKFRRRDVADRLEQPTMIEPVERGVFHRPEIAPCLASVDHFGLVEPDKAKKMNIAQGRSRRTCGGYQRLARGEVPSLPTNRGPNVRVMPPCAV
jgi:hypothetical protein